MGQAHAEPGGEQRLSGGSFYGSVQAKREQCDAIFTDLRHSSARRLPSHSHELPFFGLVLGGDYRERYGREQRELQPFTLMFRPGGIPHQDEIGPRGVRLFQVEVRTQWQKRLSEAGKSLSMAHTDAGGGELLWLGVKLFRETRGLGVLDDLCVESLLAELLAGASDLAARDSKYPPPWLRRIVEKLKAEHCRRLTLDALGREAGVHPVHLSRVFRQFTGEGIGEYVRRQRIRTACEQMLAPNRTLAEVSAATGFADQSHFTRTFRKITGMRPAAFRAVLGQPAPM